MLIIVVVKNLWPSLHCNKLIYSLLCAETSTNQLPDVISYTADHHSVFPEISSINGL